MTALTALRETYIAERDRARNGEPWRKPHAITAWNRYAEEAIRQGRPLDALDRRIEDEWERFLSRIISGMDGHAYWPTRDGRFTKNNGKQRHAPAYWLEHLNGPLPKRASVKPICGEMNCIAPPHQQVVEWADIRRQYTDAQCVGALQVAAQRLGRAPTKLEYRALGLKPSFELQAARFGSWFLALERAGLDPRTTSGFAQKWSDADLVGALRLRAVELGCAPSRAAWRRGGWEPSGKTIEKRFGGWPEALAAAGLT